MPPELDDGARLHRRRLRHDEPGQGLEVPAEGEEDRWHLPLADLDALRVEVAGLQHGEKPLDGRRLVRARTRN